MLCKRMLRYVTLARYGIKGTHLFNPDHPLYTNFSLRQAPISGHELSPVRTRQDATASEFRLTEASPSCFLVCCLVSWDSVYPTSLLPLLLRFSYVRFYNSSWAN